MILIIKHVYSEGPGTLLDYVKKIGRPYKIIELENGDALPVSLAGISAVVSLGGPMNVYEESKYPFLKAEDNFIKQVIIAEIPFLGVCLGAQLLAKAAGAKVYQAQQEEIGWFKVKLTAAGRQDPLFQDLPHELPVFQWHGDTFDLPAKGVLLALGDKVVNQAFRVGPRAYGFQFHVEVNDTILAGWFKDQRQPAADAYYLARAEKISRNFASLTSLTQI